MVIGVLLPLAFVAFVVWNFGHAEPFALDGLKLERAGEGVSLSGNVRNYGARTSLVRVEVTFFTADGREAGKETVELRDLEGGGEKPFRTPTLRGAGVASYSVYVNAGRNPYGN
jgi:hypothetical protein